MMKKSVAELEAEMREDMERRLLKSTHDSDTAMDFVVEQLAKENKQDIVKKMATLMQQEIGSEKLKEIAKKVHFMEFDAHGSKGSGVYCSCGMYKIHKRGKVLAVWADKHFTKFGHYWKRS